MRSKKVKNKFGGISGGLLSLIIIVVLIYKCPNIIYGIFNSPIALSKIEAQSYKFEIDASGYDYVVVRYWDKADDKMFCDIIRDEKMIGELFSLVSNTKIKQKLWDDKLISYAEIRRLSEDNYCSLFFQGSGGQLEAVFVNKEYVVVGEQHHYEQNKLFVASEELFEYLNGLAYKYDESQKPTY